MTDEFVCPSCGNDNQRMFDFFDHRREQTGVNCQICSKSFIHIFTGVPRENIIPKEVMRDARRG